MESAGYLLTLKNLYRMLTKLDYMSHSYPPLPQTGMKGQTVVKFWHAFFSKSLPKGTDLGVFESDATRSRSLTKLLNRSGTPGLMEKWFRPLSESLGAELLLDITRAWLRTFSEYGCNIDALKGRMQVFLNALLSAHELETVENRLLIDELNKTLGEETGVPIQFRLSLILSSLSICALYGNRLRDPALGRIKMAVDLGAAELYKLSLRRTESAEPTILTARECLLCAQPLDTGAYFGYQEELEMAQAKFLAVGTKLLISGMGGIGKTEFVRQLLKRLTAHRLYSALAFVQYEASLDASLARAFESLSELQSGTRVDAARKLCESREARGTLLLIDGVDSTAINDPDMDRLWTFNCDIIVTARLCELNGFATITLNGLSKDISEKLFCRIDPSADKYRIPLDELVRTVDGHPLALTLFASLCRARFWTVEQFMYRLNERGIGSLTYIKQASSINVAKTLAKLFDITQLSDDQIGLMRLLSVLPHGYYLPQTLMPYAADFASNEDELTDMLCILGDLGWIMRRDEGFAIHTLIAQTVQLMDFGTEQLTALWEAVRSAAGSTDKQSIHSLISVLTQLPRLNLENIRCLARLEQRVGFFPYIRLPDKLYERHIAFLKSEAHAPADEAEEQIALCMRDLLVLGNYDAFAARLKGFLENKSLFTCMTDESPMYMLLEKGALAVDKALISAAFQALEPDQKDNDALATHLISLGEFQRCALHEPEQALDTLKRAEEALFMLGEKDTVRVSNLNYRQACCYLDLGDAKQAVDLLARCIAINKHANYADSSVNMMNTRTTYAFALTGIGLNERALSQYRILDRIYRGQNRTERPEYATLMNNMALLLYHMDMLVEADKCISKALAIDGQCGASKSNLSGHKRNAALIYAHVGKREDALRLAADAVAERKSIYGDDSIWVHDANVVYALSLALTDHREEALRLIEESVKNLRTTLGDNHRFTVNALQCREKIVKSV